MASSTYKYVNQGFLVEGKVLLNGSDESYDVSDSITDVMIKDAFLENIFQLVVIDMRLTEDMISIMRDNDFRFYLKIYAYRLADSDTTEEADSKDISVTDVVFDDIIRIYDQPFIENPSKVEEDSSDSNSDQIEKAIPFLYYRISGIPENDIEINEGIVNNIYGDCTVGDAAVNMLTSNSNGAQIYIDPIQNKDTHRNILIPPMSLSEAMSFLDSQYYIYGSQPMNMYIRNGHIYVYKLLGEHIGGNILQCDILSYDATVNTEKIGMLMENEDGDLKVVYRAMPAYIRNKKVVSHEYGSETIYYTYDDDYNLSIRESGNSESFKKTRYIWNPNRLKSNEDIADLSSKMNESLAITLSGASMGYFTPITTIRLESNRHRDASGDYALSEASYIFRSSDRKHYSNTIVLTCIKKKSK